MTTITRSSPLRSTTTQSEDVPQGVVQRSTQSLRDTFARNDGLPLRCIKAGLEIPKGISSGITVSVVVLGLPLSLSPGARWLLPLALPAAAALGAAVGFSYGITNAIGRMAVGNAFDPTTATR